MALLSCLILAGCALDNKTADTPAAEKNPPQEVAMAVPEKGIPVLMYHMIGDVPDNDAVLLESHFREQMKFLKDNDFHPLTMDQLYDYLAKANRCRFGPSSSPSMTATPIRIVSSCRF